jgi:hypothetical protein
MLVLFDGEFTIWRVKVVLQVRPPSYSAVDWEVGWSPRHPLKKSGVCNIVEPYSKISWHDQVTSLNCYASRAQPRVHPSRTSYFFDPRQ